MYQIVYQGAFGENYNDMLTAVGQHSTTTVAGLSAEQKIAYTDHLAALKLSLKSVIIERQIDHAKYPTIEANKKGFTLAYRTELGYTGNIVDWEGTKALHTTEAYTKFYNDFYYLAYDAGPPDNKNAFKDSEDARKHLQVMEDFRGIQNGIIACGV